MVSTITNLIFTAIQGLHREKRTSEGEKEEGSSPMTPPFQHDRMHLLMPAVFPPAQGSRQAF